MLKRESYRAIGCPIGQSYLCIAHVPYFFSDKPASSPPWTKGVWFPDEIHAYVRVRESELSHICLLVVRRHDDFLQFEAPQCHPRRGLERVVASGAATDLRSSSLLKNANVALMPRVSNQVAVRRPMRLLFASV